jgi:hypothetical protein
MEKASKKLRKKNAIRLVFQVNSNKKNCNNSS